MAKSYSGSAAIMLWSEPDWAAAVAGNNRQAAILRASPFNVTSGAAPRAPTIRWQKLRRLNLSTWLLVPTLWQLPWFPLDEARTDLFHDAKGVDLDYAWPPGIRSRF